MAHELSIREDGFVEMAFTGKRSAIWHGLGNELAVGASIDEWKKSAGCDWDALESPIHFSTVSGVDVKTDNVFPAKKALFRSDTLAPLSIVGDEFKIVQPGEIVEFFRDLTESHGMTLSSAGVLFGGTRFWALAETGKDILINDKDKIDAYMLLTTAIDGTLATSAKFVSTRVVCNNTLSVAMNQTGKLHIKQTHRKVWDAKQVKIDLGLIDAGWTNFIEEIQALNSFNMTEGQVLDFYKDMFYDPDLDDDNQKWGATRRVDDLMKIYATGPGSELAYGTAWGALNGITNMFTHGTGKRNPSTQFWESYYGQGDKIKTKAKDELLDLVYV